LRFLYEENMPRLLNIETDFYNLLPPMRCLKQRLNPTLQSLIANRYWLLFNSVSFEQQSACSVIWLSCLYKARAHKVSFQVSFQVSENYAVLFCVHRDQMSLREPLCGEILD
jgi:hypothetical protein